MRVLGLTRSALPLGLRTNGVKGGLRRSHAGVMRGRWGQATPRSLGCAGRGGSSGIGKTKAGAVDDDFRTPIHNLGV